MFRTSQLTVMTKKRFFESWGRFEDGGDDRHFVANTRGFMSLDRTHELLDSIHADPKSPVP